MKPTVLLLTAAALALSACANETPQEKHELACVAGTLGGAVVGGLAGSVFGAGAGRAAMAAAGAGLGTYAGTRLACQK